MPKSRSGLVSISPVLFDISQGSRAPEEAERRVAIALEIRRGGRIRAAAACGAYHVRYLPHRWFCDMGDLGHALELCIAAQSKAPELFDAPDLALWNAAADKLGENLSAIANKQAPESAPQLIEQLEALTQNCAHLPISRNQRQISKIQSFF